MAAMDPKLRYECLAKAFRNGTRYIKAEPRCWQLAPKAGHVCDAYVRLFPLHYQGEEARRILLLRLSQWLTGSSVPSCYDGYPYPPNLRRRHAIEAAEASLADRQAKRETLTAELRQAERDIACYQGRLEYLRGAPIVPSKSKRPMDWE